MLLENPDRPIPYSMAIPRVHARAAERSAMDQILAFYWRAVEEITTALLPRFESGELRDWRPGDIERWPGPYEAPDWSDMPPVWRIEMECAFRFTNNSSYTFLVHMSSPHGCPRYASPMPGSPTLSAREVMAMDVLEYAQRRGWLKRRRAEA